jgi:hypothetical protein
VGHGRERREVGAPRGRAGSPAARLDESELGVRIVRGIHLVDDDHGARAAVPGRGQVALEPPRVEVEAERGDDEHGVDVRRDDLLHGPLERLLAGERGTPRQDGLDHRLPLAVDGACRDPVSDRGQLVFGQLARWQAAQPSVLRQELARPVVARRDARRDQIVCCVWLERVCEERVPAEVLQLQLDSFGCGNTKGAPLGARTGEPQEFARAL